MWSSRAGTSNIRSLAWILFSNQCFAALERWGWWCGLRALFFVLGGCLGALLSSSFNWIGWNIILPVLSIVVLLLSCSVKLLLWVEAGWWPGCFGIARLLCPSTAMPLAQFADPWKKLQLKDDQGRPKVGGNYSKISSGNRKGECLVPGQIRWQKLIPILHGA